jgi:hypothetical protein
MPASETNISFRFAERGDGGAVGSAGSGPVIDLENNRWRFNVLLPVCGPWFDSSKFLAEPAVPSVSWLPRHGYQDAIGPDLPPYCGMDPMAASRC